MLLTLELGENLFHMSVYLLVNLKTETQRSKLGKLGPEKKKLMHSIIGVQKKTDISAHRQHVLPLEF